MTNIAIFASGSGSNAENIITHFRSHPRISVVVVLSNNPDAYVHTRAQRLGVPSFSFSKKEFDESTQILDLLKKYAIDYIVLAGFLLKVSPQIIRAFGNNIVNIHPALLPKYGGKGMYGDNVHRAVIEAQEGESGITIHRVNDCYDEGNIIFQASCPISPNDSPEDLAQKVHQLEYQYFPVIIERDIEKSL